jgi:glutathione reductase (NADPH)
MQKFDLLAIGSGPAGSRVASKCAEAGWNVAMVESRQYGGTCALRGCNPKKVFVHAAEVIDAARRSNGRLCDAGDIKINWADLQKFKKTFVEDIPKNSRSKFDGKGITTFLGEPKFLRPTQLSIGDEKVEAKHILIATGARPRTLNIDGEDLVTTSDEFMNLGTLPKRVVFIGGGYISFEFAHVAARAGASVTILERGERPLKTFEASCVDMLVRKSRELGIVIKTDASVERVEESGGGKHVTYQTDGQTKTIEADLVVHGAGRTPNLDGLDLEKGRVDFDEQKGVAVDPYLRSKSNPAVIAAGDCAATGSAALTPIANAEGDAVVNNLIGEKQAEPSYGTVPAVVFTVPALASVGLTESAAEDQGMDFKVVEADISDWGSIRKVCESTAGYKVLVDNRTDQILGAHMIGPGAADMINLFALAMKLKAKTDDLKSILFAFPTFSSNIQQMVSG